MFFEDWKTHEKESVSKALLWEYNTNSEKWDWNKMSKTVVARVIERGRENDYYAILQMYGGVNAVRNIVKEIPCLSDKDMNWCCALFNLRKEEMLCYRRALSRKKLLDL